MIRNIIDRILTDWHARRTARSTIDKCRDMHFVPDMIVDCGANENQVTRYWAQTWQKSELISIEPNPNYHPAGRVIRLALGSSNGTANFRLNGKNSTLANDGNYTVDVRRFDSLDIPVTRFSLVKVDCEYNTVDVLVGMGDLLSSIGMIHVEVLNFDNESTAMNTFGLMASHGFTKSKLVDAVGWRKHFDYCDVLFWRK